MMIHNILICYRKLARIYNNCSIINNAQPLINTAIKHQYQMPTNTNLLTAITSRVATLISAPSKVHVAIEYHVMCLVLCMYSTLYSVQYGEILLS